MNKSRFQQHSLKTRIALLMLLIFILSLWSFVYAISFSLREDMRRVLGDQQYAFAASMASEVDDEINTRIAAMQQIAQVIEKRNILGSVDLQRFLEDHMTFQGLFNGGTFITDSSGKTLASVPVDLERVGVNFLDRDYVVNTLKKGEPAIGRPVIGRQLKTPIFGIGVPIKNQDGYVIAALAGVINLNTLNFIDRIERNHVNASNSYRLIDATHRTIVASSNKSPQSEPLPAPLIDANIDKFIAGFEGHEVFIHSQGFEVIAGVKHLSSTNWFLEVALSTDIAFAPIANMERRIFFMALLLTILTGGLTWWALARQLKPLQVTAQKLAQLAENDFKFEMLPVHRQDEIGQLISGFNKLLEELAARQNALKESEERYRTIFQTSPDAVSLTRLIDGKFLDINEGHIKMFGWERQDIINKTSIDVGIWASLSEREIFLQILMSHHSCERFETRFVTRTGHIVSALVSANTLSLNGEECILSVTQDITAKKIALAQIENLKYFDVLTGLANLRLLMERLTLATEQRKNLHYAGTLLYIDLDNFKTLNDSFGHDDGDLLLKEVSKRITEAVPKSTFVARMSGDKFAVLLNGMSLLPEEVSSTAEPIAQKIINAINQPFYIRGAERHSSCCIGIALFTSDQENGVSVLKHAELAMYHAKKIGRGTLKFFDMTMQELVSERVALDADLHGALKNGEYILYYQRQMDARNQLNGFEALVRWNHPTRGIISPEYFIAAAEQSGLVVPLGRWVLETACKQIATWTNDPQKSHLTISVNVSAMQFHETDYVEHLLAILKRTGAPGHRLKLELTESVLVTEIESLITKMAVLKGYGIGFSLDDFGTGFSSLSYLQRLPLDQLKIDQGFITNIVTNANDAAIAQTIVSLGNSLGLSVIAEGVETEAQRDRLFELGCMRYQGYLFGKPAPIDELMG